MKVFKIEYMANGGHWKASVLADDSNKAIAFISRLLGGIPLNVTTIETLGDVDGISDEIIARILEKFKAAEKPKKAEKAEKATLLYDETPPAKRVRGKRIGEK